MQEKLDKVLSSIDQKKTNYQVQIAEQMLEIHKLSGMNWAFANNLSDIVKLIKTGEYFDTWARRWLSNPRDFLNALYSFTDLQEWEDILMKFSIKLQEGKCELWIGDRVSRKQAVIEHTLILRKLGIDKDVFDKIQKVNSHFGIPVIPDAPECPTI